MNNIEWIATTQKSQWQSKDQLTVSAASSKWDVEAYLDQPLQTIEGFGACFNELGWTSLNTLASADKEAILRGFSLPVSVPTSIRVACRWALTIFRSIGILMTRFRTTSTSSILVFLGILKSLSRLLKARCNISQLLGFGPQRGALQSG